MNGSPKYTLNSVDWMKILKGAGIAILGAGGLAAADQLQLISDQIDFGWAEAISVAVVTTCINAIRKWVTDTTKK